MFEVTSAWKSTYPQAHVGVLVMRAVSNPAHHAALESRKTALEEELRARFSRQDRTAIATFAEQLVWRMSAGESVAQLGQIGLAEIASEPGTDWSQGSLQATGWPRD